MKLDISVLQPALVALGQRMLDTGFAMNPEAARQLHELQDIVIGVEITDIQCQLFFTPHCDRIQISTSAKHEPNTWIRSSVVNLLKARRANPGDGVNIEVSGDVAAGQTFQHILQSIDFDWEELLAMYLGDIAAHRIGQGVKAVNRQLRRSFDSLAFSTGEYLREEAGLAADADQIRQFIADVDQLRDDIERLSVRLQHLDKPTV